MLSYNYLAKRPSSFRNFTGISLPEFEQLMKRFVPLWQAAEGERLNRAGRQRAIGGGRKYELELRSQVVMTLVWLHLYLGTETLGILFGVNKATVSRNTRRVVAVLRQVGEDTVWWQEPPSKGQSRSLTEAAVDCPDLLAVLDVMEQRVQRPQEKAANHSHYSAKAKAHTRKIGLITNEQGRIRGVTASQPGRTHDLTLFRQANLLPAIPKETAVTADKAFAGLANDLPDHSVAIPHKAGRHQPLDDAHQWANRDISAQRIIIENTICELRHFKILADRFRHAMELVDDAVRAVIALVNPRIARRLALAGLA